MRRGQKSDEKNTCDSVRLIFLPAGMARKELKEGGVVLHDGHSGPILPKSG